MGLMEVAVLVVLCCAIINPSNCRGEIYKVGDSNGWTTVSHVDYESWAATKSFRLGDVIVFRYVALFHNVMQVTHAAYQACNASSPIATHTSGNDSITLTSHGHHFFICGVPGHCQTGQKVDINVHPALAPTPSSFPASASTSGAPPPAIKAGSYLPSTLIRIIPALSALFLAPLVT